MPVFVARSIGRPVSSARIWAICRCCGCASESAEPGRVGRFTQQRRLRQRADDLAAEDIFVADVSPPSGPAISSGSWRSGPGMKLPIGMRIRSRNHWKPGGTNSPKAPDATWRRVASAKRRSSRLHWRSAALTDGNAEEDIPNAAPWRDRVQRCRGAACRGRWELPFPEAPSASPGGHASDGRRWPGIGGSFPAAT